MLLAQKIKRAVLAAGGSPSFDIADLFAASEQGVWYDPSDLSTMFQDTGATVPVTTDGDPVRYLADKSGNAVHLSHATGLVYRTDGAYHWLEFSGTYLVASGSKTKMAFAHSPGGGYTGCYGVRFGVVSNPDAAYALYSNSRLSGVSTVGINGWYDDRSSVPRDNKWGQLVARHDQPAVILALSSDGFLPAATDHVLSEVIDPDAATAARHSVRTTGGVDRQNNTQSGTATTISPTDEFTLGAGSGSFILPMTGRLYQFVIVEGQLDAAQREDLESTVAGKTP